MEKKKFPTLVPVPQDSPPPPPKMICVYFIMLHNSLISIIITNRKRTHARTTHDTRINTRREHKSSSLFRETISIVLFLVPSVCVRYVRVCDKIFSPRLLFTSDLTKRIEKHVTKMKSAIVLCRIMRLETCVFFLFAFKESSGP